jgi:hemerythrin-like domain-containing protein
VGSLLEKHVRFEEREVYPQAESLLAEDELASVRDAALRRDDGEPTDHRPT